MELDGDWAKMMVTLAIFGVGVCVWVVVEEIQFRRQQAKAAKAAEQVIRLREEMRPVRRVSDIERIQRRAAEDARLSKFMVPQAEVIKYPMPKEQPKSEDDE